MALVRRIGLTFKNRVEEGFLVPKPEIRNAGIELKLHVSTPGIPKGL